MLRVLTGQGNPGAKAISLQRQSTANDGGRSRDPTRPAFAPRRPPAHVFPVGVKWHCGPISRRSPGTISLNRQIWRDYAVCGLRWREK